MSGSARFSVRGQIESMLSFARHLHTTEVCCWRLKDTPVRLMGSGLWAVVCQPLVYANVPVY